MVYHEDPYREPSLYDLEYEDHIEDIRYYTTLAVRSRGPVLELAVGNGRIAIPTARAGVEVHGLDVSGPMLQDLRTKLASEEPQVQERVRAWQDDYRHFSAPRRYPLVTLPFNALHHCADHRDLLSLLGAVRRALEPKGRFALDCYLPDPRLYHRQAEDRYGARDFVDPRTGGVLSSWEQSWYEVLTQVHHVTYVYRSASGHEDRVELHLRMFYPAELRGILDLAGFELLSLSQDFKGTPPTAAAVRYVMVLAAR